jgi:hypothetical protein
MSDMLSANRSIKNVADFERDGFLNAIHSVMHAHFPIMNHKHFLAVIGVSFVRLVGPVQAGRDDPHVGNVHGVPWARCREIA